MELMVATAIIGIGIMGSVSAFQYIAGSSRNSKARTLASNLAQEKMQILKQQSYYRLLVTTSTAYRTEFSPNIPYDDGYYDPETLLEGSIAFERLTFVQVAREDSGEMVTLPATTPDTGLKLVTVTVVWRNGSTPHKLELRSVAANPDTVMSNSTINGGVRNASSLAAIPSARVNVAENVGWQDTTNASGNYTINLSPGNYNLVASAEGFYTALIPTTIGANQTLAQNFDLTPISSGVIRGSVWVNDHLVISQVVGSSETPVGSGFYQEYVEVFNPTTWTWTLGGGSIATVDLKYQRTGGAMTTIPMAAYHTTSVAPGAYYLFANTSTVNAVGVSRNADAEYVGNFIEVHGFDAMNDAAAVGIAWATGGAWIDQVGWTKAATPPPFFEGSAVIQASFGLENDEQFVRRSSTAGVLSGFGRAYDSGNNHVDFVQDGRQPLLYPPRNSSDTSHVIVAGTPAYGAVVSATDGLSNAATAYSVGSPPYAEFLLPSVATGTYFVSIASGSRLVEIDSVTVLGGVTSWAPNAVTVNAWPSAGHYSAILSSEATMGFISGRITNVLGGVISPAITVEAGGVIVTANSQGYYTLELSTGFTTVTANSGNANASYVSQDQSSVLVQLGHITSNVNFILSQGGKLQARITRDGINPLPGVAVVALDSNGILRDEEVSGTDGRVLLVNLATGTYSVQTILDSGETSSPISVSSAVVAGATVNVGTFTVSGAFGAITGSVSSQGQPIRTGVLIVASTSTATTDPPALSSATLASAPYYLSSSSEDGTYRVEVRGSTTTAYRVQGYYYTMNNTTPVLSSAVVTNVSVTAGQATGGVNFSW
jgi:hypothetical protein